MQNRLAAVSICWQDSEDIYAGAPSLCADTGNSEIRVTFKHAEDADDRCVSTGEDHHSTVTAFIAGSFTRKRHGLQATLPPGRDFHYVLKGSLKVNMDGMSFTVPTGCLFHIRPTW